MNTEYILLTITGYQVFVDWPEEGNKPQLFF